MEEMKKEWSTPELVVYGTVEDITGGTVVCKSLGSGDDLATIISTTTGCH
jgi:hypothetical protein